MAGLPRANDKTRPREAFAIMVLQPVERLTDALRRGDPFSEQALRDMDHLANRLDAFRAALAERIAHAEAQEVIE